MHAEAEAFVAACAAKSPVFAHGLDVGGRNVNGTCRRYFRGTTWEVLDIAPGDGVDIVANFGTWRSKDRFDLILCTEVLEHDKNWEAIIYSAWRHLVPGGRLVLTAAADPRKPHSAVDGGPLRPGEYYGNIRATELWYALETYFAEIERFDVDRTLGHGGYERGDIRAMARK